MNMKFSFLLALILAFSVSCKKVNQKKVTSSGADDTSSVTDTTPPSNLAISIDSGAAVTSSISVTLSLSATDADKMYITNTAGCGSGGAWEAYNTSKAWTLSQTNTTATVYVKFRGTALNESACVSDTIVHDDTAPSGGSISINGGASTTSSTTVTLTLSAADADDMYVTNTSGCGGDGAWQDFTGTTAWTLSQTNTTATVYVKYRDANLNETSCFSDTITHDNQAPTGESISINSNATYTSSTVVTLTLGATGASEMCVTNTAGCTCSSPGDWESYNSTKMGILGQTNSTATVHVKYRDAALNETSCINDTITHDNTAPSGGSILINNGGSSTTSTSITLNLSASGASDMYITNTSGCSSNGTLYSYNTTKAWTLEQTNGTATVYVKFIDATGNETGCLSDTITQVDDPPTVGAGLSFTNIGDTSVTVSWGAGTDAITSSSALQYKVVRATMSADIDTTAEADIAITVTDWTTNIISTSATGLTSATTYYFAVLVKDGSNNKALYYPKVRFTGKMIYVTSQGFRGNLGGISGADSKCSSYRPGSIDQTSVVKALIVDETNRRACTSHLCLTGGTTENIDWVMTPNTNYYNRLEGFLWATNAGGVKDLSYSIPNSIDPTGSLTWTGMGWSGYGDWRTSGMYPTGDCLSWSSSVGGTGVAGNAWRGGGELVYDGGYSCGEIFDLYCVEQ